MVFLADFSRRMDREGWSVDNDGKLTKNDKVLAAQIRASEGLMRGEKNLAGYPYMPNSTIARRKGRFMFQPIHKSVNTGRPLRDSKYPKKLQNKLDEKLFANNTRLMEKKFDSFMPELPQKDNIKSSSTTPTTTAQTKTTTTPNKPVTKTGNKKLLNKYTIGAAGLLGASGIGYAGYKYATRNKNNKK